MAQSKLRPNVRRFAAPDEARSAEGSASVNNALLDRWRLMKRLFIAIANWPFMKHVTFTINLGLFKTLPRFFVRLDYETSFMLHRLHNPTFRGDEGRCQLLRLGGRIGLNPAVDICAAGLG